MLRENGYLWGAPTWQPEGGLTMTNKSDKQQAADDFERTFGVSAKDLANDHEHQRRLVDMANEAERLQATNAGSTTERYNQLRTGAAPVQSEGDGTAQAPAES